MNNPTAVTGTIRRTKAIQPFRPPQNPRFLHEPWLLPSAIMKEKLLHISQPSTGFFPINTLSTNCLQKYNLLKGTLPKKKMLSTDVIKHLSSVGLEGSLLTELF